MKVRRDRGQFRIIDGPTPSGADGTVFSTVNLVNTRSHVVGFAANYSEEKYTQSVFRVEAALSTGVPVRLRAGTPRRLDDDNDSFIVHDGRLLCWRSTARPGFGH